METIVIDISKLRSMFWLALGAFSLAMLLTPFLTDILYRYKLGKRIREGATPVFSQLHKGKENTPTMGGILVWVTVFVITLTFNNTRNQTWLLMFTMVTTALLGMADDLLNIYGIGKDGGGLRVRHKLIWQIAIAAVGAWWFYTKLGWGDPTIHPGIHIPMLGDFFIGWWYIPLFVFIIAGTSNAVNFSDGLDGLAGGLLMMAFTAYAIITFSAGSYSLAAFCVTMVGALLAFLWFNIYPARFFMGDTGSLALGATLGVLAMITNTVAVLPIIAFVFVAEALSVIIQIIWRKTHHGAKLLKSAPIHHHFEALGWPETKVTMRFWVIGAASAIIGVVVALLGRG